MRIEIGDPYGLTILSLISFQVKVISTFKLSGGVAFCRAAHEVDCLVMFFSILTILNAS